MLIVLLTTVLVEFTLKVVATMSHLELQQQCHNNVVILGVGTIVLCLEWQQRRGIMTTVRSFSYCKAVDFNLVKYFTEIKFSIKEQKRCNGKYTQYIEIFPLETQTEKTSIFYIHS
jgi:hypothetical protein